MNYEQLNREYWGRVFDMCESYNKEHGTDIKPWQCVRHDNKKWPIEYHPPFELRHPDFPKEKFSFAIAILEGNPVFVGDEIYAVDGRTFIVKHEVGRGNFAEVKNDVMWRRLDNGEDYFTWTKPQQKRRSIDDPMRLAEGLIEQLPDSHEGAISWLMHHGDGDKADAMRKKFNFKK